MSKNSTACNFLNMEWISIMIEDLDFYTLRTYEYHFAD